MSVIMYYIARLTPGSASFKTDIPLTVLVNLTLSTTGSRLSLSLRVKVDMLELKLAADM